MLIITLAAMTWVTSTGILMYVTELWARKPAASVAGLGSAALFGAYVLFSRAPTLADRLLTVHRIVERTDMGTDLYTIGLGSLASVTLAYTLFGAVGGLMVVFAAGFLAATMTLALVFQRELSEVTIRDDE